MGKKITDLAAADQPVSWDTEYIATRDTAAATDKTRRRKARDYKDDWDAGIATATAAAQAAQDTADLAIPLTQKGAANGVATLDATGKVPVSQINATAFIFKGFWNATTNSPTLSDGIGVAGDQYIIQVNSGNSFVRNLGSGNVDWNKDSYAIYNGTIYVENEATDKVVSVNGFAGVVDLDADDIDPTASHEYVTPDLLAALNSSTDALNAGNAVVSKSELDAAIIAASTTVIGGVYCPQLFDDGINTSGTGELKLLSTLGYSNATAAVRWPLAAANFGGTIQANNTSLDDVIWASAFEGMKSGILYDIESLPNRAYAFQRGNIAIPNYKTTSSNNTDSQQYSVFFRNALYRNASGNSFARGIFYKLPSDQTDADTNCIDNRWKFFGGKFKSAGVNDIGIEIGATRSAHFEDMEFQGHAKGIYGMFLLNSTFERVNTSGCVNGIYISQGNWVGAGISNSVSQPSFYNCRHRVTGSNQIGVYLTAVDNIGFYGVQGEGTAGSHLIFIYVPPSATVSKNCYIHNIRSEIGGGTKWANAVIGFSGREFNTFQIDGAFTQAAETNTTLLETDNAQGTTVFEILNVRGNNGGNTFKFKNVNSGGAGAYRFRNTQLQGAPQTAADVVNTAAFPNIWTADSDIPPVSRIDFLKSLV